MRFVKRLGLVFLGAVAGFVAAAAVARRAIPSRGDAESDEVALAAIFDGIELKSTRTGVPRRLDARVVRWNRRRPARGEARTGRPPERARAFRRHRPSRARGLEGRVEREGDHGWGRRPGSAGGHRGPADPDTRRVHALRRASRSALARQRPTRPPTSSVRGLVRFVVSFPERLVRAFAAVGGGAIHETAELVLPRLVRRSRLYEATAKNLLRITVELVGGVEHPAGAAGEVEPSPAKLAVRKTAGNVVEVGSIAAFGFSPLWLLAAAADVTHGTRVYLDALVSELQAAGVVARDARLTSVDSLLAALEGASGTTARLIDIPPLEVEALKQSLADLRGDAGSLPTPEELDAVVLRPRGRGRSRAQEPARGLRRRGARVLQLRPQGRSAARPRRVHGGSASRSRRGLRSVRPPRRETVRRRRREAVRSVARDGRRARHRSPRQARS